MDAPVFLSHNEVQSQGQQGVAPLRFAIAGNEQQKDNDHQIAGIEIPGQQLPQKVSRTGLRTGG